MTPSLFFSSSFSFSESAPRIARLPASNDAAELPAPRAA